MKRRPLIFWLLVMFNSAMYAFVLPLIAIGGI